MCYGTSELHKSRFQKKCQLQPVTIWCFLLHSKCDVVFTLWRTHCLPSDNSNTCYCSQYPRQRCHIHRTQGHWPSGKVKDNLIFGHVMSCQCLCWVSMVLSEPGPLLVLVSACHHDLSVFMTFSVFWFLQLLGVDMCRHFEWKVVITRS
jgi:hypothetical protein